MPLKILTPPPKAVLDAMTRQQMQMTMSLRQRLTRGVAIPAAWFDPRGEYSRRSSPSTEAAL